MSYIIYIYIYIQNQLVNAIFYFRLLEINTCNHRLILRCIINITPTNIVYVFIITMFFLKYDHL